MPSEGLQKGVIGRIQEGARRGPTRIVDKYLRWAGSKQVLLNDPFELVSVVQISNHTPGSTVSGSRQFPDEIVQLVGRSSECAHLAPCSAQRQGNGASNAGTGTADQGVKAAQIG